MTLVAAGGGAPTATAHPAHAHMRPALAAGTLRLAWHAITLPRAARSPVLAPGAILWLAPSQGGAVALFASPWRGPSPATPVNPVAPLGLAVGAHEAPALLLALGRTAALAAVVPQTGLQAGVVANVWALGRGLRERLANLDPAGTRPRLVADQPVAVGGPAVAILAQGASAGFPAAFRPVRDLLVRWRPGKRRTALCPLPHAVPPGAVLAPRPGVLLLAARGQVDAVVGCPGPVRLQVLGRLPAGLSPMLAGVAGPTGRLRLTWLAGLDGTQLGAWRAPRRPGAPWPRIWSVPAAALAVTPLPPGLLAATAAEGRGTATRVYQAATGQSVGPYASLSVVSAAAGAALVRDRGRLWLIRPKAPPSGG